MVAAHSNFPSSLSFLFSLSFPPPLLSQHTLSTPTLLHCPPLVPQSTFLTLSGEWLTPWSRCAAPSWDLLAGTLSLNVSSSFRKSPPSWGPAPGNKGKAPEWIRPQDHLHLQAHWLSVQYWGARGPGKPRVMVLCWGKANRTLQVDVQQE